MKGRVLRAYLAGLLDGEGYIGIKRRLPSKANRMASYRYSACISVSMTDREGVDMLGEFTGTSHLIRCRTRGKNKPIFEWMIEHGKAVDLARAVLPFLLVKKRQALLLIELHEKRQTERLHRTKVGRVLSFKAGPQAGKPYRSLMHSNEYIASMEAIYQATLVGAARSGNGKRFAQ